MDAEAHDTWNVPSSRQTAEPPEWISHAAAGSAVIPMKRKAADRGMSTLLMKITPFEEPTPPSVDQSN